MKNTIKTLFASFMILTLSTACSTIYFQNGSGKQSLQNTEWHHDGILRLVEFSDPVDLNSRCRGGDWTTVKTEKTFIGAIAGGVTFGIYDPWEVSTGCVKVASVKSDAPVINAKPARKKR